MTNLEALKLEHKIQRRLLEIEQTLELHELKEPNMAVSPQTEELITKFDVATNAIATRIQNLVSNTPALSADDQAAFQAEIDKLTALGQDPNNPVPGTGN